MHFFVSFLWNLVLPNFLPWLSHVKWSCSLPPVSFSNLPFQTSSKHFKMIQIQLVSVWASFPQVAHVIYVSGAENPKDHNGLSILCFWQTPKWMWGHHSTCTTCTFGLVLFFSNFDLVELPCHIFIWQERLSLHLNSVHGTSFPSFLQLWNLLSVYPCRHFSVSGITIV